MKPNSLKEVIFLADLTLIFISGFHPNKDSREYAKVLLSIPHC